MLSWVAERKIVHEEANTSFSASHSCDNMIDVFGMAIDKQILP